MVSMGRWAEKYAGKSEETLELCECARVADAVRLLGIPGDQVGMTAVNNQIVGIEHELRDGDILKIFPILIGG